MVLKWLDNHVLDMVLDMVLILFSNNLLAVLDWLSILFHLLQDNYDNLGEECLDSVKTYTQMEAKNAVLNPVIATACHGYIDRYCSDEVLHKVSK